MKDRKYAGIDPGKKGAIVVLSESGEVLFKSVVPTIGKEYDEQSVKHILSNHNIYHAVLENVHAIQGAGGTSNFSFGQGEMLWRMGLTCLNIPFTRVLPSVWQKEVWQGVPKQMKPSKKNSKGIMVRGKVDTKSMSLIASKRLFPNEYLFKSERSSVEHDGIVDALLMAEYCRRRF